MSAAETGSGTQRRTTQWRWYHYYFMLAVFDLIVIIASLVVYHRTLQSYEVALRRLGTIHAKQRWVASLRLAVIDINTPGNRVFASRHTAFERQAFHDARERLRLLLKRTEEYGVDLSEFLQLIEGMVEAEREVFAVFTKLTDDPASLQFQLERASVAMAAMDKNQAAALTSLTELEQNFLMRVDSLLNNYRSQLLARGRLEKLLLATVVVILILVFWYGRKLQHMHEDMVVDQQQAIISRHERLAAVGELSTGVAHGIRNPLAAISSSAQLCRDAGTVDDRSRRRLDDILTECGRLDQRITRLLRFASESSHAEERYDLRGAIEQAIQEISPKLKDRNVDLTSEFCDLTIVVSGDRERMVQAVIEVLANAIDHVPEPAKVELRCRRTQETPPHVEVDFVDNGPGIPEAVRTRVFDLFFTTTAEGTGIGLANVRHAVQMHRGTVSIVPDQPGGTHIRLRLPLA